MNLLKNAKILNYDELLSVNGGCSQTVSSYSGTASIIVYGPTSLQFTQTYCYSPAPNSTAVNTTSGSCSGGSAVPISKSGCKETTVKAVINALLDQTKMDDSNKANSLTGNMCKIGYDNSRIPPYILIESNSNLTYSDKKKIDIPAYFPTDPKLN